MKVDHLFPMRSLDKATTAEELNHFVNATTSGATRFPVSTEVGRFGAFAGVSNGRLVERPHGSGERGEDAMRNARKIANVPHTLPVPVDVHVRGEVVMPLAVFETKYKDVSPISKPRSRCSSTKARRRKSRRLRPRLPSLRC